jgi:hypothetical protein
VVGSFSTNECAHHCLVGVLIYKVERGVALIVWYVQVCTVVTEAYQVDQSLTSGKRGSVVVRRQ